MAPQFFARRRTFAGGGVGGAGRIPAMSDQAIQAEVQRLQCLQALGITVYHPRFRLPGAKPSVQGIWPDADSAPRVETAQSAEPVTATATARVDVARPVANPANARVAMPADAQPARSRVESISTPAKPAAAAKGQTPSAAAPRSAETSAAPIQNFQLLFLQIDDDLALINQIPALARPQLQDRQLALLTNLLRWLGKSVPAQAPRMFRWPLPGLEHMAGSMSAETSLLHFLEQASSERGFRFLLQLGPQAVAPEAKAWQAFATHSLDEMLALPALKREVWQTLLPLHELLHTRS
jgi:hypothetical protein